MRIALVIDGNEDGFWEINGNEHLRDYDITEASMPFKFILYRV